MSSAILRAGSGVRPWGLIPIEPIPADPGSPAASQRLSADPVELVLAARAQAEEIVQAARAEAAEIARQALMDAEKLRAQAYQEGFKDGVARGLEDWSDARREVEALAAELPEAYGRFCEAQVPELARLATAAAEMLLKEQLTLEPERIVGIVEEAVRCLNASSRICVHLHPEDLNIVRHQAAFQDTRQGAALEFVADNALERGGCWLESEQGQVDATVEGRVDRLALAFEEA